VRRSDVRAGRVRPLTRVDRRLPPLTAVDRGERLCKNEPKSVCGAGDQKHSPGAPGLCHMAAARVGHAGRVEVGHAGRECAAVDGG
jgi:hypothetical protein